MSSNNSLEASPSPTPSAVSNNAPKYGTLVPNRVFVGGISASTTETELHQLFSAFGNVKATKIINDRAGVSKGYGFVTFETEEEARRSQQEADNIILKERKLNIAPAIKKQPFSRNYEASPSPSPGTASPTGTVYYHNGTPYTYQNGMAVFPTPETYAFPQPQAAYPMMYPPQPVYVPHQQYQYQATVAQPQWTNGQWRWLPPVNYNQPSSPMTAQYMYPPAPVPIQGGPPPHPPPQDTSHSGMPATVLTYSPTFPTQGIQGSSQEMYPGYGPPSLPTSSHVHQYQQDQGSYSLASVSTSSHVHQYVQDQGTSDIPGVDHSSHNTEVSKPQPRLRHYSSPRKVGSCVHHCPGRNGHSLRRLVPKTINGVHVLAVEKNEDAIGAAGDAPLPPGLMTPPATPVTNTAGMSVEASQMQHRMSDTVQQMQALTL